jgi:DNA-binding NarL/FixJ family response regulator
MKQDRIAVIFDDHKLFADSFSSWLEKAGLFAYVYTFADKTELLRFFFEKQNRTIFLFSDYYIGDGNSVSTLNDIKRICPAVRIILISSITNPLLIQQLLQMKPKGFLSKAPGMDEVLACIRKVEQNHTYISPYIQALADSGRNAAFQIPFTPKEIEVLTLFAKGHTVIKTAEILNLSKHTIISHRRKMMSKAKCNTIIELLAFSRSLNIIT